MPLKDEPDFWVHTVCSSYSNRAIKKVWHGCASPESAAVWEVTEHQIFCLCLSICLFISPLIKALSSAQPAVLWHSASQHFSLYFFNVLTKELNEIITSWCQRAAAGKHWSTSLTLSVSQGSRCYHFKTESSSTSALWFQFWEESSGIIVVGSKLWRIK